MQSPAQLSCSCESLAHPWEQVPAVAGQLRDFSQILLKEGCNQGGMAVCHFPTDTILALPVFHVSRCNLVLPKLLACWCCYQSIQPASLDKSLHYSQKAHSFLLSQSRGRVGSAQDKTDCRCSHTYEDEDRVNLEMD